MGYTQLINPDTTAGEAPGFCLGMATKVFFGPQYGYSTAWEAWEASPTKNGSRDMPGVAVPVWFSWIGDIGYGTYQYGHVCVWIPGRGFLSSPGSLNAGYGQQWFGSLEEIERWFACQYVGFTLDIMPNGTVAAWNDDPAPAPAPVPSNETLYTVVSGDTLWGIAVRFYGDGTKYPVIANANGIENPNLIFPGQTFVIPGV